MNLILNLNIPMATRGRLLGGQIALSKITVMSLEIDKEKFNLSQTDQRVCWEVEKKEANQLRITGAMFSVMISQVCLAQG